jgi:hypothetical protein
VNKSGSRSEGGSGLGLLGEAYHRGIKEKNVEESEFGLVLNFLYYRKSGKGRYCNCLNLLIELSSR